MPIAPSSDPSSNNNLEPKSTQIRWLQVWCLASVQGAITLSWIAYGAYLPKFIEQVFGYPPAQALQFSALLLLLENAIGVIVEPLFGGLSDRWQRWYSSRMPLIVAGAIASTAFFIGLPSLVIFGGANEVTRFLLPCLAVLWALMMASFRSPVMCLLGGFAGSSQLPMAGSVLTLVGGVIGSIRPFATNFILSLGAPITFAIASFALLAGVASLRTAMIYMPKKPSSEAEVTNPAPIPAKIKDFLSNLAIVLLVGALIGIGMRLLMGEVLQRTLKAEIVGFTGLPIGTLSGSILIFQAVIALGTGTLCKVIDNKRLMMISFGVIAFGLGLLSFGYGAIASILVIILLLICVSAVNNGMVAFALTMVPKSLSGLTVGLFFGGLSGAIAVFGYLVPKPAEMISNSNVSLLTAIAFLSAGIAIAFGERITRHLNVD